MRKNLAEYIAARPIFRILGYLGMTQTPCHLRQLVAECGLSPGGVSDILQRLSSLGILGKHRDGNKIKYSLSLSVRENELLGEILLALQSDILEKRARKFSKNALPKFEWMDEAYKFFQEVKHNVADPVKRT